MLFASRFLSAKTIVYFSAVALVVIIAFLAYVRFMSLKLENAELKQQVTALTVKIEEQNAGIIKLQHETELKLKNAQQQLERAKIESAKAKRQADSIFNAQPSAPSDLCKSALDLINKEQK